MIATMVEMIIIMTMMPRCPRTTAWACTPSSGTSTPCSARTSTSSSCPSQSSSWWWGIPLRGSSPPLWINYTALLGWGTWRLDDKCGEVCSFPTGIEIQRGLLLRNVWCRYRKDVPSQISGSYSTKIQSLWYLKTEIQDSRRTPCSCARSQVLWSLWNIWWGTKIFYRIWKISFQKRSATPWVNTTSTGGQCSSSAPLVTSSLTWSSRWRPLIGILIILFPQAWYFKLIGVHDCVFFRDTEFILSQRNLENEVSLRKKHSSTQSQDSQVREFGEETGRVGSMIFSTPRINCFLNYSPLHCKTSRCLTFSTF